MTWSVVWRGAQRSAPHETLDGTVSHLARNDLTQTYLGHRPPGPARCQHKWRVVLVLSTCFLIAGCLAPKRVGLVYPIQCLNIRVQDFTRPCVERSDGRLLCDGVVVAVTCSQVSIR